MATVHVGASAPYDVHIDEWSLDDVGALVSRLGGVDAAFVVSDSNVAPLYLQRALDSLARAGIPASSFTFEAGERSKTVDTWARCLAAFAKAGLTRASAVVALGGGVVGDLAGFAAASWMRGCRCIQVPTSLLAAVDSSVGGKTALDLPQGKNLVGAFFQPSAVLIDTTLLESLPAHFFTDGCAEVLKYGVIADADLFSALEDPLVQGDARTAEVVRRCVEVKRDIVQADERERGLRQTLNFGHTLGHAIERLSDFSITHGFAVACGMVLAARAACVRGQADAASCARLVEAVRAYGLPDTCGFSAEALAGASMSDKKRQGDVINVIGLRAIGSVEVEPMSSAEFRAWVAATRTTQGPGGQP